MAEYSIIKVSDLTEKGTLISSDQLVIASASDGQGYKSSVETLTNSVSNVLKSSSNPFWTGRHDSSTNAEVFNDYTNTASGNYSHAEGQGTIASGDHQHVQGKFNESDSTKAFIIGNGIDDEHRNNIATIDWNGNLVLEGSISIYNNAPIHSIQFVDEANIPAGDDITYEGYYFPIKEEENKVISKVQKVSPVDINNETYELRDTKAQELIAALQKEVNDLKQKQGKVVIMSEKDDTPEEWSYLEPGSIVYIYFDGDGDEPTEETTEGEETESSAGTPEGEGTESSEGETV